MTYLISFIVAFLVLSFSQKKIKSTRKQRVIEILVLSFLSLVAALRDTSIGTDVKLYVKPLFELSRQYGIFHFNKIWLQLEPGYILFNIVIATFTAKFSIYLFLQQFFIMFFSYYGIKKVFKNDYSFVYLLFLLLFYNRTLNIVRQAMALSLCLYSLHYLINDKKIKFFLTIFGAAMFHYTSIIFIGIYFVYYLYMKNEKYLINLLLLSTIVGFVTFFAFKPIIIFLTNIGILPVKYIYYTQNYVNFNLNFNVSEILLNSLIIIVYICFGKLFKKNKKISSFYFALIFIDSIALLLSSRYITFYRLGMYFKIPALLYFLSNFKVIFKPTKESNFIANVLGVVIALIFWIGAYGIANDGETIPYKISHNMHSTEKMFFCKENIQL